MNRPKSRQHVSEGFLASYITHSHPKERKLKFLLCYRVTIDSPAHDKISGKRVQPKWEGKACAEVAGCKAEQVWPLLEDFFGLHKWFPTLTTCLPVEGVSGRPGCVQYCAGFKTHANNGEEVMNWTKQKLLWIKHEELTFSYSIIDGNVGFNSYVSTIKVEPNEDGCSVEWRYEVEPVEGWTLQDLDSFIGSGLQVMAKRMEEAIKTDVALEDEDEVTPESMSAHQYSPRLSD